MRNPNIDAVNSPGIYPYILVNDVEKAIGFYQQAFAFSLAGKPMIENGIMLFAAMRYDNGLIMIGKAGELKSTGVSPTSLAVDSPVQMHVCVDNVDDFFNKAVTAGATIVYKPELKSWGEKTCKLKCPDKHIWCFAELVN